MTPAPARAVALVVLDSVGIGGAPDAAAFGDEGSATLPHVAEAVGGLSLPNLAALGLGHVADVRGVPAVEKPAGAFGTMVERSAGKDTTTGHWELAGVVLERPFPTYPEGFPPEVMERFEAAIGSPTLGNVAASGTEIIERLGAEHVRTGAPIVYTSADSVFQIAAHVDVVPLETLYEMCRVAREILRGDHEVGRVIARPFEGSAGSFRRTPDRHDFSVLPPRPTVLDSIAGAGAEVRGVGKIADIFAGSGVTTSRPTRSNEEGITAVVEELAAIERGLVFANLVEFDSSYGHRNDPAGYAAALEAFDIRLPEIAAALGPRDVLLVTADHGNDPTTPSTDHSRERVPLLAAGPPVQPGATCGERSTFADCGATIADLLGVQRPPSGASFASEISRRA
ncbi:MAG TPA: phosphopentomutase [Actinomycetota bacterium]|nr:phosphopentomutase [Actinomycetota bacterium]